MGLSYFSQDMQDGLEKVGHTLCELPQKILNRDYDEPIRGSLPPFIIRSNTPKGIVFGKHHWQYICRDEWADGHVVFTGPPGSMKTRVLIETLRAWREAFFVIDIKKEIYEATKETRPFYKVIDPDDEESDGYDPFWVLENSETVALDIANMVQILMPLPEGDKQPFFIENARLFVESALHHFYVKGYSFLDIVDIILEEDKEELAFQLSESPVSSVRRNIKEIYKSAEKSPGLFNDFSMIITRALTIYATDGKVRRFLSKKKVYKPTCLEEGWDVSLAVKESRLRVLNPLYTLICCQSILFFENRPTTGVRPILFVIDEFARLGKMKAVIEALGTLRGRKITMMLILQSLSQVDDKYSFAARQAMMGSCSWFMMLGSTDTTTQEDFAKRIGKCVRKKKQVSYNDPQSPKDAERISENEVKDWIVEPAAFGRMAESPKRLRTGWKHWRDREYVALISPYGYHQLDKFFYH